MSEVKNKKRLIVGYKSYLSCVIFEVNKCLIDDIELVFIIFFEYII